MVEPNGPQPPLDDVGPSETPPAEPRRRFEWWWLLAGTAVVVAVVVAGMAVVAAIRGSFGDRMATAAALPPDTAVYLSMDLEGLARFDRVLTTFDAVTEEAGMEPGTDVLDLLDEAMLSEFGLSTDDFEPWIGRDVGVALFEFDVDSLAEQQPPPLVVAASVRDEGAADEFMPKMVAAMERQGMAVSRDSYGDVALWVAETDADSFGVSVPVVMGRSDDMMLLASDQATMRRAIDAQGAESLRDAENFTTLVDELPGDRAVTLYVGPEVLAPFTDLLADPSLGALPGQAQQLQDSVDSFKGLAMALTIDDAGIRLDAVQAFEPTDDVNLGAQSGSELIAETLPSDTFAYFGIGPWDVGAAWDQIREALESAGLVGDLADLEAELGVDVEQDVVAALSGELGIGLFPATTGLFAELGEMPFGGMLLVGLADRDAAGRTLDRVNRLFEDSGLAVAEVDGLYALSPDGEADRIVYGLLDDLFVVATDRDAARRAADPGDRLVDSELWNETRDAIGSDGPPLLFVDLGRAVDAFDVPPDVAANLAPLRAVAAAAETGDGLTKATFMALIDWADE